MKDLLKSDKLIKFVLGITVVCPQAISNRTAERAINAVRTALDVSASKICITT